MLSCRLGGRGFKPHPGHVCRGMEMTLVKSLNTGILKLNYFGHGLELFFDDLEVSLVIK